LFKFPPQCSAINSDQKTTTDDGKPQLKRTKDAAHWNLGLYEPSWRLRLDLKSIRSSLSIATSCDVCDACPTHRDKRDAIVFIPTAVAISLILGFLDREPGFWQCLQKNHAPCHLQPEVGGSLQASLSSTVLPVVTSVTVSVLGLPSTGPTTGRSHDPKGWAQTASLWELELKFGLNWNSVFGSSAPARNFADTRNMALACQIPGSAYIWWDIYRDHGTYLVTRVSNSSPSTAIPWSNRVVSAFGY
jgi:hypothetical protein